MNLRSRILRITLGTVASLVIAAPALANEAASFPSRPVRWVVPFPAGGATDVIARIVGQRLAEKWGQPVVVENRAGAAGTIGSDFVAKASPDGYTILMGTTSSHAVGPATGFVKMPYDNIRDFSPVTLVATYPNVLIVPPGGPKTMAELVRELKSKPGKLSFGSSGSGSSTHLTGEMFKQRTGAETAIHVPYKGTAPLLTDVSAGHVTFAFDQMSSVLPLVESGKLRALGVTSRSRNEALPDVPTVAETLPGFEADAWIGIFAPARTPVAIVDKIQADVKRVLEEPEVRKRLKDLGATGGGNQPAEFGAFVRADTDKWRQLVRTANIKADN